jgi:hypothetical protein
VEEPFDFQAAVAAPSIGQRKGPAWRIGTGDHLEVPGERRRSDALVARIVALSSCQWAFVPLELPGAVPWPVHASARHPVLDTLADRRFVHRQDLVRKLTRFPLLHGLSFDAVRYVTSFFRVRHYPPHARVFEDGDEARPTLLLAGLLQGPDGLLGEGATLFPDDLTGDPSTTPSTVAGDYVVRRSLITAELPAGMAQELAGHDPRLRRHPDPAAPAIPSPPPASLASWPDPLPSLEQRRAERPWFVLVGDGVEEAPPDTQTLALNLAAAERGSRVLPTSATPTGQLVVDADYARLAQRAPGSLAERVSESPDWETWTGPEDAFGSDTDVGVVGLDPADYASPADVEQLVDDVDRWLRRDGRYVAVWFRLPRAAGPIWAPLAQRARTFHLCVSDLFEPQPPVVPSLTDVVRAYRPHPRRPGRGVSQLPLVHMPVDPEATQRFWATGVPWVLSEES